MIQHSALDVGDVFSEVSEARRKLEERRARRGLPGTHGREFQPSEIPFDVKETIAQFSSILANHMLSICQIVVPGIRLGTGCIIEGGLILTNHHVFKLPNSSARTIEEVEQEAREVAKTAKIRFDFINHADFLSDQTVIVSSRTINSGELGLNPDRFFYFSPSKEDAEATAGALDYVLVAVQPFSVIQKLRLIPFKMLSQSDAPLSTRVAKERSRVYVIEYPKLREERFDTLKISKGVVGNVQNCWVDYIAATHSGSSGGAVVDEHGNLVALHYRGGIPGRNPQHCDTGRAVLCNSGVSIQAIVAHLPIEKKDEIKALVAANQSTIEELLAAHLINYFRTQHVTSVFNISHGEDWRFPVEDVFTNLVIINRERKKERDKENQPKSFDDLHITTHETIFEHKTTINIEELFNQDTLRNESRKRAIIYGAAGVGKTTFAEMAALHGAKWWPQFSKIFLIKLRNLNSEKYRHREDYSLEEVLAVEHGLSLSGSRIGTFSSTSSSTSTVPFQDYPESEVTIEDLTNLLSTDEFKNSSLLVLDGFDELSESTKMGDGPLRNILAQLFITFRHILITSRPGEVRLPYVSVDYEAEFEIVGFDGKSINQYIDKFHQQLVSSGKLTSEAAEVKAKNLQRALIEKPVIYRLVQIPLNLALACTLYKENEKFFDSTHGFTLTTFYTKTIAWFYSRFLSRHGRPTGSPEHNPKLSQEIEYIDVALQEIAWSAMKESKMQIFDQSVERKIKKLDTNSCVLITNLKNIGLLKFENDVWKFTSSIFGDYFAAKYLSELYLNGTKPRTRKLLKVAKKRLRKIKFDPRYLSALQMTAGILSDKKETGANATALQRFFSDLFDEPRDASSNVECILFAKCFEQCRNSQEIPQYPIFLDGCVQYMQSILTHNSILSEKDLLTLFYHSHSLIAQELIINKLLELAKNSIHSEAVFSLVGKIADSQHILPSELERLLVDRATIMSLSENDKRTTVKTSHLDSKLQSVYDFAEEIFKNIYDDLLKEENLKVILPQLVLHSQDATLNAIDILVDHLILKCVEAANQNAQLTKLQLQSYEISIDQVAKRYAIKKISIIENSLVKIGFSSESLVLAPYPASFCSNL